MELINYTLDNGMKVLLLPNAAAPVVACNVWVGVGSADETPQEAGLAHVHEHMLFKGTQTRGVGQIAREVEAAGGHINAFTSFDQTCYYVVMSSRDAERGLDILSDAIARSSFDAQELGRELEVIQEEIKRGEDSPSRVASLKLFDTAYKTHPYRLPVIGTKESVDSFRREHVVNFFQKHYVPENMAVVLAGDFEPEQMKQKVDQYFGPLQGPEYAAVVRPKEPVQHEVRAHVMAQESQECFLRLGFHIPDATHPDIPALELIGAILGLGESSRLYGKVQREQELVNSVYAGSYTPREAGLFMVNADYQLAEDVTEEDAPGARSHEQVLRTLLEVVFSFENETILEHEFARAKTVLESHAIYGKQTVEGLAMKLGQYQMVTGDPLFEDKYYDALGKLDATHLREVAATYLRPENCAVVLSHPPQVEGISQDALESIVRDSYAKTRSKRAPIVAARLAESSSATPQPRAEQVEVDAQGFAVFRFEQGPTVVVQENHDVEIFSAKMFGMGGLRAETPRDNGVSSLLTELIMRGTSEHSATEIALAIESMASGISGTAGRNTFGLSMTGLSKFFDPCAELFAQCLFDAQIPEDEFYREQRFHLQDLKSRQDQLGAVNFDLFARTFFKDHPYAMPMPGTSETIAALTPALAREALERMINPAEMVIAVVGDVQAGQVKAWVESHFLDKPIPGALPLVTPPESLKQQTLVTADLNKNQAHIIVGFDSPTVESPERYALDILHAVLSGQGGRLFYELRDKQSLAYSVYASMLMGPEAGSFMVNIGTSPEKIDQAIDGILEQIQALHTRPPTAVEIQEAKQYLIGHHDISLQQNSTRATGFALDELYGLGFKRTFDYGDHISAVTSEDIEALILRYLNPENAVIAVTKPEGVEVAPR